MKEQEVKPAVYEHRGMKYWKRAESEWVIEGNERMAFRTGWECIVYIDEVRAP